MQSLFQNTYSLLILLSLLALTKMGKVKISQNYENSTQSEYLSFVGSTKQFKGQLGSDAYLECSISNLSNMSMAWVRIKDNHILTVDKETFISDRRYTIKIFLCLLYQNGLLKY